MNPRAQRHPQVRSGVVPQGIGAAPDRCWEHPTREVRAVQTAITRPSSRPGALTAAQLAAATPDHRYRYADLLRAVSIGVVVIGHWLLAVISTGPDGALTGQNALALSPGLQRATWLLQVMPLFFLVGGYANAASYERDGVAYGPWLRGRVARLVTPTLWFAGAWSLAGLALAALGVPAVSLALAAQLVAVPLWFLAVYLLVVALAPVAISAHRRVGLWAPAALLAGVVAVDVLRLGADVPLVGWLNFPLVWLLPHQLGVAWRAGSLDRRGVPVGLAVGGLLGVIALTTFGPYPVSMVGVPGAADSNNAPPSLALAALTLWHTGLALVLRRPAERWLQRPKVWTAVVTASGVSMTVFLWHLTAMVVFASAALPLGFPQPAYGTAAYWLLRPVWIVGLLVALAPFVAAFARVERPRTRDGAERAPAVVTLGVLAAAAGMALLATHGFRTSDLFGVPWPALALIAGGARLARA